MALDASRVLVGTADQTGAVGAIYSAPIGTTLPTSAVDTLNSAFTDSGYVSEDGLTFAPDLSTADINEWNGALVRRIKEKFDGSLSWSHLETNEASLKNTFGDSNVTVTAANATHGNQIAVAIDGDLPAAKSWAFKLKDGDNRILIVVPNGQVTDVEDVSFKASEAIMWGVTLSCYPDESGNSLYIYADDGQLV
jgi:hypothetical protein